MERRVVVGIHRRTNQYVMCVSALGIREARTIMRFPDESKFDPELAQAVNISPQHVHAPAPHDQAIREQFIPQASIPHEGDVDRTFKRLYIWQNDVVTY